MDPSHFGLQEVSQRDSRWAGLDPSNTVWVQPWMAVQRTDSERSHPPPPTTHEFPVPIKAIDSLIQVAIISRTAGFSQGFCGSWWLLVRHCATHHRSTKSPTDQVSGPSHNPILNHVHRCSRLEYLPFSQMASLCVKLKTGPPFLLF